MSNNRHEYVEGASATGPSATERVDSELTQQTMNVTYSFLSVAQKPISLNATYKTPTSVSLEWTFSITVSSDYSYVVYSLEMESVTVWPSLLTVGKTIHMN